MRLTHPAAHVQEDTLPFLYVHTGCSYRVPRVLSNHFFKTTTATKRWSTSFFLTHPPILPPMSTPPNWVNCRCTLLDFRKTYLGTVLFSLLALESLRTFKYTSLQDYNHDPQRVKVKKNTQTHAISLHGLQKVESRCTAQYCRALFLVKVAFMPTQLSESHG